MSYTQNVDGYLTDCSLADDKLCFCNLNETQVKIELIDIISIEDASENTEPDCSCIVHIIQKEKRKKWTNGKITFRSINPEISKRFTTDLAEKINKVKKRRRNFLVVINPIGGNGTAMQQFQDEVKPLFDLADITTTVLVSERAKHVVEIVKSYDFTGKDGIILCGGDGTFYECMNTLLKKTQEEAGIDYNDMEAKLKPIPLTLAQIPTGSINGISLLGTGVQDVVTSTLHIIRGEENHFGASGVYSGGQLLTYSSVLLTFGVFADLLNDLESRRWLKVARYIWVPIYHFLIRRQPSFDAEIRYYAYKPTDMQDIELPKTGDLKKPEGMVNGRFCNMTMLAGDNCDENFKVQQGHGGFTYGRTVLNLFEPCSRLQLLNNFMKFIRGHPDSNSPDFIKSNKVTGVDVKLKEEEAQEFSINVDGEKIELKKTEFQVRLHGELLTVYCSRL